jgi:Domain of unknown function (DUF378)
MTAQDLTGALVVVGGLNWGLVGLAKLDPVATLTGNWRDEPRDPPDLPGGRCGRGR